MTPHLSNYLIPGVLDVAEIVEPVILELPDLARAAWRAAWQKCRLSRLRRSIAAAIHDATGVRDRRVAVYAGAGGHCARAIGVPPA